MDASQLATKSATIEKHCLFHVLIPPNDVSQVLEAITKITPLRYGRYEQVVFRSSTGIQQYRSLAGSQPGEGELVHVPCDEISFAVPKQDEIVTAVIEAIFECHPYEEPVILIPDVMRTRFKYA